MSRACSEKKEKVARCICREKKSQRGRLPLVDRSFYPFFFFFFLKCQRSRGDPKKLLLVSVIHGGKETKAELRIKQCDDAWQICVGMYRPRIVPGVLSVTCD